MVKNIIITTLFTLLSFISNSQVITVYIDTAQFFEHSVLLSTPQATESNKLVYLKLYENKPNFVVKFDLDKKIEYHTGYEHKIIKVNNSTNIVDVVVQEGSLTSLVVFGATEEGGIMYLYEYKDGDLMRGYFSKNPKFEITK